MEKTSKGTKILIIAFLFFALAILALIPIVLGYKFGLKPTITEFWLQYLAIFLSGTSFIAVIFTLWIQYREIKIQQNQITKNFDFAQQEYDSQLLNKIDVFMGESMKDCRNRCWVLRAHLKTDKNAKKELFDLFTNSIKNNWGNRKKADSTFSSERFKDYSAFIKLIRYFDVLSHYTYTPITIHAIHYYYIFYRSFFKEVTDIYLNAYSEIEDNRRITETKHGWSDLTERMDKIVLSYNMPLN